MNVNRVYRIIERNTVSLYRRLFAVDSPLRDLNYFFLSLYLDKEITVPGTILDKICKFGHSPVSVVFDHWKFDKTGMIPNGVTDSLNHLVFSEGYDFPGSSEHHLVSLLTRAF